VGFKVKRTLKAAVAVMMIVSMVFFSAACSISAPNQGSSDESGSKDNASKESASSGDVVTLSLWDNFTSPETGIILDTIITNFQKENPNIKVKRNSMKNDDLRNTIKPALTSKNGPDIFNYDSGPGYLGVLAKAGLALDLTPYAEMYGWDKRFPAWINERVNF
jgi:raffinose/stachyose/melibiose transport system substrate-binding protein